MIAQQAGRSHSLKPGFGRFRSVAGAILLAGWWTLLPANASGTAQDGRTPQVPAATGAATKPGSCICRAQGIDHELGTTICLRGPKGPRMAQCVMVLNNTSWKFSDAPCALASAAEQPAILSRAGTRALSLALWAR